MANEGILTKSMESLISTWLDDQVKLNGIYEAIDGLAFKLVISQLDNNFGDKIPEPYKEQLKQTITVIFEEKDYEKAISDTFIFLDELIDVPYIDDESEALMFQGFMSIVMSIIAKLNTEKQ